MPTCKNCRSEVESLGTAYLTRRARVEDVCGICRDVIVAEDMTLYAKEIVQLITNQVNGGSAKVLGKALSEALEREHRYLQSEALTTLFHMFESYQKAGTDARNEWAVGYAKRCVAVISPSD